jgi:hypothetical protein
VAGERAFPVDLDPPTHPRAAEYARAWFTRLSQGFADRLVAADRAALEGLLAAPSALAGQRLHIRGTRTVTLGRRPALSPAGGVTSVVTSGVVTSGCEPGLQA